MGGTIRGNQPCKSQQNVVFIKTHKTASSTTAGIFDLYAYRHNLTVAVPPDGRPYMNRTEPFHRDMIAKTRKKAENWKREVGFNIFRDKWIFTNRRLILVDVQGMTGRKIQYLSSPYAKITKYSIETTGTFDLDAELKLLVGSESTPIHKTFNNKVNIYDLQKVLSKHVLN